MEHFTNQPRKVREIELTLTEWDIDIWRLRELALSEGGLMNQELRRKAWPKLLGISAEDLALHRENWRAQQHESTIHYSGEDDDSIDTGIISNADESVAKTLCESQVDVIAKDVHRCSYISHEDNNAHENSISSNLRNIIHGVLYRGSNNNDTMNGSNANDSLHYYQGFHNISAVMLLHFNHDAELCGLALDRMTKYYLTEFMKPDFRSLQNIIEHTFLPLLHLIDPELHDILIGAQIQPSTFVLSWMIALFSHERACIYDAHKPEIISRILDAILAAHPIYSMYIACAVLVLRRDCLLQAHLTGGGGDDVHVLIGGLFSDLCADVYIDDDDMNDADDVSVNSSMGVELLLKQALEFMRRVSPDRLRRLYLHRCGNGNGNVGAMNHHHHSHHYSDVMLFRPSCTSIPATIRTDWAVDQRMNHAVLYAYTEAASKHNKHKHKGNNISDNLVSYGDCPKSGGSRYRLARIASGMQKETYCSIKGRIVKKRLIRAKRRAVHTLRKMWRVFCALVLALYYDSFLFSLSKLAMQLEMAQQQEQIGQ